jgi:hypothetical protein
MPYTRATTVARALESEGGLANWTAAMTAYGITMRPGLRARWEALMAEYGDPWYHSTKGKALTKELVNECKAVGGSNDRREQGSALHTLTALADLGRHVQLGGVSEETAKDLETYRTGLATRGIELDPNYVEYTVVLDSYQVAGTPDRLARVPGFQLPLIADLKTGADLSYSWQSMCVQLAIYSRGEAIYEQGPAADGSQDRRVPIPYVNKEWGLIIWLPVGGELELHLVNLDAGWEAFAHSMWARGWHNRKDIHRPLPSQEYADDLVSALEASIAQVEAEKAVEARGPEGLKLVPHNDEPTDDGICIHCGQSDESHDGEPCPEDPGVRARQALAERMATAWPADLTSVPPQPEIDEYQPPPTSETEELSKQVTSVFDIIRFRSWLQGRIDDIGKNPNARQQLMQAWPRTFPPLKKSTDHTVEQLEAIEKILDDVERRWELPFPDPDPRKVAEAEASARILYAFPGSTTELPLSAKDNDTHQEKEPPS